MSLVRRSWLVILMTLFVGAGTGFAQGRVQLAQGRRAIQDKVSFVVDITRDKRDTRTADSPDDMRIMFQLLDRPASGKVYLDGKAVGRFDDTQQFSSNSIDVTYGRHTITLALSLPATLGNMYVDVRGGVPRELLDEEEPSMTLTPDLAKRVGKLERKVHDLEAEVTNLKKKRNH